MENFIAYNPTSLHFGKSVMDGLGRTAKSFGSKALLVYGQGSVLKNGIYQKAVEILSKAVITIVEYSGIKPNPVVEDVDAAAVLGRKERVDMVIAIGGGSVIDSAKIIAITIPASHGAWDFYEGTHKPQSALPLLCVLTLAATGTEMNPFAVLQNNQLKKKLGYGNNLCYPRHSFLDPMHTLSIPRDYTAYGIADLIAHSTEAWFGAGDASLSDKFIISIIKEAFEYGPALLENLHDYDLRARIMYAATAALNRMTFNGKVSGDWGIHSIGHVLSLLYDLPHGATLSIAFMAWMKHHRVRAEARIELLGHHLFGGSNVDDCLRGFENFYQSIQVPLNLIQAGISKDKKDEIYQSMVESRVNGSHYAMGPDDYGKIVELMFTP